MGRRSVGLRSAQQTPANPEDAFEQELEVFRTEAGAAAQFFYAFLRSMRRRDSKEVLKHMNTAPLFWNGDISPR
jgi:hypothetical protein